MKNSRVGFTLLLVFSFVLLLAIPLVAGASRKAPNNKYNKEVVGYFIEWGIYGRNYLVKDIVESGSAEKLTVINYAFGNVEPINPDDATSQVVCKLGDEWADYQIPWTAEQSVTGEEVTWPNPMLGNFQQLHALKQQYPNIRVLISLGGWTWSKWFSDAALTEESREAFVESCIDLFIEGNLPDPGWGGMGGPGAALGVFDGIDVDWEYPATSGHPHNIYRPEDTENFTLLLEEFREQLDELAAEQERDDAYMLTIAAPAGPDKIEKLELDEIHKHLDFINVMTYDFHGSFEDTTNFQSNLYRTKGDPSDPRLSTVTSIREYKRGGVPRSKLVMGIPFYGRGWTGVTDEKHGLFQSATGPAPGVWEDGIEDYKVLEALLESGDTTRYWSQRGKVPWLFDGTTFWTYDDPKSICYKTSYITRTHLRGVMFWELSGDTIDGELITAVDDGLNTHKWNNRHCRRK